ncbi:hypothetical protein C1H46_036421 [Malus baccata]|uniref:Uncharacterized protein n=1 Tax=Malus baccata TaxID=106549 RepID=A0A540KUW4_MALBA|nr:hypothetical protein C1H46_036421 [Malus baccata]
MRLKMTNFVIWLNKTRHNSWKLMRHSAAEVDDDSQSTIYLQNEEEIPSHVILSLNVKDPRTLTKKGNNADAQVLGTASILGDVLGTEDKEHIIRGQFSDKPAGSGKIRANNLWDVSSGETEAAASNLKDEPRPPGIRPLRVLILSPWNSIRVALNEESVAVGDAESFRQQHGVRSGSSSNSECGNSDATLAGCHGDSFDGFCSTEEFFADKFLE